MLILVLACLLKHMPEVLYAVKTSLGNKINLKLNSQILW